MRRFSLLATASSCPPPQHNNPQRPSTQRLRRLSGFSGVTLTADHDGTAWLQAVQRTPLAVLLYCLPPRLSTRLTSMRAFCTSSALISPAGAVPAFENAAIAAAAAAAAELALADPAAAAAPAVSPIIRWNSSCRVWSSLQTFLYAGRELMAANQAAVLG